MKVGNEFLATQLTVMENNDMPFLFGLDMLRRHQCQIDLKCAPVFNMRGTVCQWLMVLSGQRCRQAADCVMRGSRHRANVLRFTNLDIALPFLQPHELPSEVHGSFGVHPHPSPQCCCDKCPALASLRSTAARRASQRDVREGIFRLVTSCPGGVALHTLL